MWRRVQYSVQYSVQLLLRHLSRSLNAIEVLPQSAASLVPYMDGEAIANEKGSE
jgi:hypothetical protein